MRPLSELCIQVVADNFELQPSFGNLSGKFTKKVTENLTLDLPLELAGTLIEDETYWARRGKSRWKNCEVSAHGNSWRQLYFERNLECCLEQFDPSVSDVDDLKRLMTFSRKFVRSINLKQFPSHLDLQIVFDTMHTSPTSFALTYGMQNVGMDYDRSLFGMKLSDCRSMAKALERTETLTYLNLSNNMLDDDKVRMIASGMVENISITHLDLSHNKIADRGVRALAKLLDNRSVISILNLSDNQIHSEGGRALARAIRGNFSLISLNVRLNRLMDDGGRTICDVLRANQVMERLNIGSNQLGALTVQSISALLRLNHRMKQLDLSGNHFDETGGRVIREALDENTALRKFDIRLSHINTDDQIAIEEIMMKRAERLERSKIVM